VWTAAVIFTAAFFICLGAPQSAYAQDKPNKVILRFAADFAGPPHPAGLALKYFAERLPQVIPGSEARLYYAGALYTIPEAFEANHDYAGLVTVIGFLIAFGLSHLGADEADHEANSQAQAKPAAALMLPPR